MANDLSPKINDALAQLDPANNDHWTNDGLPNTGVVQRIANDQTIRRQDIQGARPGFDRYTALNAAPASADFEEPLAPQAPIKPIAPQVAAAETVEISDDQLHAVLDKRIKDAEAMVEEGRRMESEGQNTLSAGLNALNKARADFHRYFPPTTQAELIKEHLRSSNAERAARVAARGAASQLDASRRTGNARGWNGQAQSRGPGGIRAFSRKEAQALGMVVPGSAAATGRPAPQQFRGGVVKA